MALRSFCNNILTYGTDIKQSDGYDDFERRWFDYLRTHTSWSRSILILNKEKQSESSMKSIKVIPPKPIEDSISSINANPSQCYFYDSVQKQTGVPIKRSTGLYFVKWSNSAESVGHETFSKLVESLTNTCTGYHKITVHQITE